MMRISIRKATGFSIVEIMVGVLVGLLSILVVMKFASVFSDHKNTTSSNSNAQENGLLAMNALEASVRSAGNGLLYHRGAEADRPYPDMLLCGKNDSTKVDLGDKRIYGSYKNVSFVDQLQPASFVAVTLTDGGNSQNNSDMIIMPQANTTGIGVPTRLTQAMADVNSDLSVERTLSFNAGDMIMVVDDQGASDRKCSLLQVSSVSGSDLKHVYSTSSPYNPNNANKWPVHSKGSVVFNLGSVNNNTSLRYVTLKVDWKQTSTHTFSHALTQTTRLAGASTDLSNQELAYDVVNIQAQYGISASRDSNVVTQWVNPTGSWANPSATDLQRIVALRVALVARSGKHENYDVTPACTAQGNTDGPCVWQEDAANAPMVKLGTIVDWKQYRYRIYQTVIPLRNVMWAGI